MAKRTVYTCDVCHKELEKAAPVHATAQVGKKTVYADICCPGCGKLFMEGLFESEVSE